MSDQKFKNSVYILSLLKLDNMQHKIISMQYNLQEIN